MNCEAFICVDADGDEFSVPVSHTSMSTGLGYDQQQPTNGCDFGYIELMELRRIISAIVC